MSKAVLACKYLKDLASYESIESDLVCVFIYKERANFPKLHGQVASYESEASYFIPAFRAKIPKLRIWSANRKRAYHLELPIRRASKKVVEATNEYSEPRIVSLIPYKRFFSHKAHFKKLRFNLASLSEASQERLASFYVSVFSLIKRATPKKSHAVLASYLSKLGNQAKLFLISLKRILVSRQNKASQLESELPGVSIASTERVCIIIASPFYSEYSIASIRTLPSEAFLQRVCVFKPHICLASYIMQAPFPKSEFNRPSAWSCEATHDNEVSFVIRESPHASLNTCERAYQIKAPSDLSEPKKREEPIQKSELLSEAFL